MEQVLLFLDFVFCQECEYNFHVKEPLPTSRFWGKKAYVVSAYMVNEASFVYEANIFCINDATPFLDMDEMDLTISSLEVHLMKSSRKKCTAPIHIDCFDAIAGKLEHVRRQSHIHLLNIGVQHLLLKLYKLVEFVYPQEYQGVNSNSVSQQNTGKLVFRDKRAVFEDDVISFDKATGISAYMSSFDEGPSSVLSVTKLSLSHVSLQTAEETLLSHVLQDKENVKDKLSSSHVSPQTAEETLLSHMLQDKKNVKDKLSSSHVSPQTAEETLSSHMLQDKENVKENVSSRVSFQDRETMEEKSRVANYVGEASENYNFSHMPINEELQHIESEHRFLVRHSRIRQHFSDFTSLNEVIKLLFPEVPIQMDAQSSTIYHALVCLCDLPSTEIEHLFTHISLPQFMIYQDASGNTPLHLAIEAQNYNAVAFLLRFAPPKWLVIKNDDGLTPLELTFEKKLWELAHALAEHQIQTGTSHEFLQEYFLRAMREQGGVDFLPYLLDLRERYFPDLDLNFSVDGRGRTPWWYLANSNDVSVMRRALQTLKDHSIDLMQLVTHTERQTKLVEEAACINRELFKTIQEIPGWHPSSGAGQDTEDGGEAPSSTAGVPSQNTVLFSSSSFSKPDSSCEKQQQVNLPCMLPTLHSWDADVQQHSSDISSLKKFIQSLPPEVLTMKDSKCRTICHALVGSCGHLSSAEVNHLVELLSRVCLQCMVCQDAAGNTPLHCVIEAQNSNVDIILRSVPDAAKCLVVRNEDDLTPLELAFEKKLWVPARTLAEHQIKHGASPVLLQEYFYKAMREQGGVDFLPHLLDLRERYFPDLDLNFSVDGRGRTPWWYLANSDDVSVMCRALQTLKDHSIDFMPLLTHTKRHTRLVEEAADKNRKLLTMIQKVAGWHHSDEGDQDTSDGDNTHSDFTGVLSRATSCSSVSTFFDQQLDEKLISIQHESGTSYKASMTSQDCCHSSPTSDSASEKQKQDNLKLKLKKRKSKKLVQKSQ